MRKSVEKKTTAKKQTEKKTVSAAKTVAAEAKAETKAAEVKADASKAEETKADVAVVKEPVKEAAPAVKKETKTTAKKTTASKETTAAKETTASKETKAKETKAAKSSKAVSEKIVLQIAGREDVTMSAVIEKVKAAYVAEGHSADSIKNIEVYIKLEESMAYYVIDGYASGISLY